MAPILSEKAEQDHTCPKVLASLSDHYGQVNAVRWSHSGAYLASCSDDGTALVYRMHAEPARRVFGDSAAPNLENWKVAATLRGHLSDVVRISAALCLHYSSVV